MWNSFRNNICHEDIHKGNWGVNISEDNKPNLVIYDFGLCARLLGRDTILYDLLDDIFVDNGDTTHGIDDKVLNNIIDLTKICLKDIEYDSIKRFVKERWTDKDMLVFDTRKYINLLFECGRENNILVNTSYCQLSASNHHA